MTADDLLGPVKAMGTSCWAARHTDVVPINGHHIFPLGHGGPDVRENKIDLCANHHYACHDLLAKMLKSSDGRVPWPVRRRYGIRVRQLAEAGYQAIRSGQVVRPDGA